MSSAPASSRRYPVVLPSPNAARLTARLAGCLLACLALPAASLQAQAPGTLDAPPAFTSVLVDSTFYALLLNDAPATGDVAADVANETVLVGGDRANFNELDSFGNNLAASSFSPLGFGNLGRIVYTAVPQIVVTDPNATPPATAATFLVGGQFGPSAGTNNTTVPGRNVLRLNVDGSEDTSFNPGGAGANNFVTSILPQPDGNIVIGGEFTQYNGNDHVRIVRLTSSGAVDPRFSTVLNIDAVVLSLALQISPVSGQTNGQILVAGAFGNVGTAARTKLARLNADGSVDTNFNPNFDARVDIVVCQPDGKILVGGDFLNVNGKPAGHVARLNYDGSLDTGFVASVSTEPAGFNLPPAVYVIRPLPDGRIFLGGNFAVVDGKTRNFLGRVNADGTLDGFDPGNTINSPVQSLAIQRDNRLLLGLTRTISVNGVRPPTLIRIFGDPAPATDLPPVIAPPSVVAIALNPAATFSQPGQVAFTRSGTDLSKALNLTLKVNQASLGSYRLTDASGLVINKVLAQKFTVTIPAGASAVTLNVKPTRKYVAKVGAADVNATFKVLTDASGASAYQVGSPTKASVLLQRRL